MFQSDKVSLSKPLIIQSAYASRAIPLSEISTSKKPPVCYQTDERYFCSKNCCWKASCKALTAAWLRRN